MKRMAAVLCLVLATSLVTSLPAQAGHHHRRSYVCAHHHWHTYVGLESPVLHLRWGDLKTSLRVCYDRSSDMVKHKKTRAHMRIVPNGTSDTWGTEWHVYGPHQAKYVDGAHQNYSDKRFFMGTFRNCQGIGSAHICGPTGHFTVVLTFNVHRLVVWDGSQRWTQYRRAGEPGKSPDSFDKKIRFYDSP